jgi:hypothetical protein
MNDDLKSAAAAAYLAFMRDEAGWVPKPKPDPKPQAPQPHPWTEAARRARYTVARQRAQKAAAAKHTARQNNSHHYNLWGQPPQPTEGNT